MVKIGSAPRWELQSVWTLQTERFLKECWRAGWRSPSFGPSKQISVLMLRHVIGLHRLGYAVVTNNPQITSAHDHTNVSFAHGNLHYRLRGPGLMEQSPFHTARSLHQRDVEGLKSAIECSGLEVANQFFWSQSGNLIQHQCSLGWWDLEIEGTTLMTTTRP